MSEQEGLWAKEFPGVAKETYEEFLAYHKARPHIWKEFEKLCLQAAKEGVVKWSADNVLHVVRWNTRSFAGADMYKINNNFSSMYARAFLRKYPQFSGFFELRKTHEKESD